MNIDGAGIMDEHETNKLLDRWAIPVVPGTLVTGPGRHEFTPIRKLASNFSFPVALKAIREDIVFKTDLGAVVVGVPNVNELAKVWEDMHQRFPDAAWLIQPFLPGDLEVIVAAQRHPVLGPFVSIAPGGIMRDLYRDVAVRPAPLSIEDALEMIAETKLGELLTGFRGLPPHEPREVAEVVVNAGWLMVGQPQVRELEIGPLLLTEQGPVAVGSRAAIG
ncbi:MAG: acetate--CoA ligase family protein [Chloroflexi bacterium]|nr:acetate--CoA ligase family protein [Chloroflexota bacterium]